MGRKLLPLVLFVFFASALSCGQANTMGAGYVPPDKIVMVWDYISKPEDNSEHDKRVVHKELDVVSPTWFAISNAQGNISSLADMEYVQWAHDNGLEVWALFENSSNNQRTLEALSSISKRRKMIEQIAGYALEYGIDGINIDFEAMSKKTGQYFEKFIIELSEKLKPLDVCLSVDIPLPVGGVQKIYDINLIAEHADYIVIMGYDQHHAESDVIGPVAAIDWVTQGIEETLQHVASNKIILGVPFFTRVWIENRESGVLEITSEFKGMQEAYDAFEEFAAMWHREEGTEQIYAEYDNGLKSYKVWLEDEYSLSLKLDTINDYNLAGMSAWRRGLEWPEIWDLIDAYFD